LPCWTTSQLARLDDQLSFSRNGRTAVARRVEVGRVEITGHELRIGDAPYAHSLPPLPIRAPDGTRVVHAYQWDHRRDAIYVCVVLSFRPQRLAVARQLTIANELRPDLTAGIIVDSGEVRVGGATFVRLRSGLGDGYYPVFALYNLGLWLQAVVLDFQIYRMRRLILLPGQELDEFGIVRRG
jgi:hypothetical protein